MTSCRERVDSAQPLEYLLSARTNLSSVEQLIEELVEQAERLEGEGAGEGDGGAAGGNGSGEAGVRAFLGSCGLNCETMTIHVTCPSVLDKCCCYMYPCSASVGSADGGSTTSGGRVLIELSRKCVCVCVCVHVCMCVCVCMRACNVYRLCMFLLGAYGRRSGNQSAQAFACRFTVIHFTLHKIQLCWYLHAPITEASEEECDEDAVAPLLQASEGVSTVGFFFIRTSCDAIPVPSSPGEANSLLPKCFETGTEQQATA